MPSVIQSTIAVGISNDAVLAYLPFTKPSMHMLDKYLQEIIDEQRRASVQCWDKVGF